MAAESAPRGGLEAGSPLSALRGIGPVRARELAAAGFRNVGELLFHLPYRYEDRRSIRPIGELAAEGRYTLRGRLSRVARVRIRRRRLSLVRAELEDASGRLPVVWFNRPYLPNQVEEGVEYLLHGALRRRGERWELVNPTCERPERALLTGAVVPVYPALGRLGSPFLRSLLDQAVEGLDPARSIPEHLPTGLLRRHRLPALGSALARLHRPGEGADVEALNARASPGHRRLIYGELLELQLRLGLTRATQRRAGKPHRYRIGDELRRTAASILPFKLTGAQRRVLKEIVEDLRRPEPMLRLLQGDVGSGKTIVAALAVMVAIENGLQAAFMAPTELLAEQHFRRLSRLLGDRYRIALLTGSAAGGAEGREGLAAGRVQLAVGTHALIQERVRFARLGLAVIDEQHRFGVAQRRRLQRKGRRLDLLVMTATPIPRSLALTLHGDLDLSLLDEMPPGRQPPRTRVLPQERRRSVYGWLRKLLAAGSQAYVVLPLIEISDRLEVASLEERGEELKGELAEFRPLVLHGRTPADEREEIMRRFAGGEARVLLATSVIEVGVDVPSARVMVIENAERFGLAQLHQLRGRIGRGGGASHCVALHGRLGEEAARRLEVFAATSDGFRIADADLEIRGPGDLLGTRQAGLPLFRVADIVADRRWLERAREDARALLADPEGEEAGPLLARVRRRFGARLDPFSGG